MRDQRIDEIRSVLYRWRSLVSCDASSALHWTPKTGEGVYFGLCLATAFCTLPQRSTVRCRSNTNSAALITGAGLYRLHQPSTSHRSDRRAAAGSAQVRRSARWALGILGELLSERERAALRRAAHNSNKAAALVTGATGGIGEEVCRGLAARGYDVSWAPDAARQAVAEGYREEFPGAHKCVVCDLNKATRRCRGRQPAGEQRGSWAPPPTNDARQPLAPARPSGSAPGTGSES